MKQYRGMRLCLAVLASAALVAGVAAPVAAAPPNRTQTPAITARPVSPTGATSATFEFASSTPGAVYSCSLDGGAAATCTSPWTYTGMKNGGHTFSVKAQAPGAKPSGTASATWTVDTVAPNAPTVTGPAPVTNVTSPAPTFSSSSPDVVAYLCSLDGAPDATCTSGSVLSAASEGPHTFSVHARDAVGNVSAPTVVGWIVDTSVSAPFVLSGPVTLTAATDATFSFVSADADAVQQCRRDSGAWTPCTSPVTYTGLAQSAHTFQVQAVDPVGNTASSDTFTWNVVASTPLSFSWTDPTSLPSGVSSSTVADFDFAVTGYTTLTCYVDSVLYQADCSSPVVLSALTEGRHTFTIVADDGLPTKSTLSFTWEVDLTPPGAPTVSAPEGWVATTSATVLVNAASAADRLSCTVDGASTPCVTGVPISLTGLAQGLHVVVATTSDKAGNLAQAQATWNVDSLAPVPTVTTPTTLVGAVSVAFNDQVTGAGSNPALELADGTAVATTRVCLDGAGTEVACGGWVRRVVLTPVGSLVPGGTYVVSINKAGTTPVADLAGNAAVTAAPSFRAVQTVQENSPLVVQTWRTVASSSAKGGSYVTDGRMGARATWTFTGSAITVYPVSGPGFGYVTVYVDGVKKAAWNQYAATKKFTSARVIKGLANKAHTIAFQVTGKKGAIKATGFAVGIDAVKVGATVTKKPAMRFTWSRIKSSNALGLYKAAAALKGQSTALTFMGTGVTWTHSVGRNHGKAEVWIDGVKKATVDLFATTAKDRVTWTLTGLSSSKHTIRIVVTGTKRTGATGTLVTVDALTAR